MLELLTAIMAVHKTPASIANALRYVEERKSKIKKAYDTLAEANGVHAAEVSVVQMFCPHWVMEKMPGCISQCTVCGYVKPMEACRDQ